MLRLFVSIIALAVSSLATPLFGQVSCPLFTGVINRTTSLTDLVVGDFNGDSLPDVAATGGAGNGVDLWFNRGNNTFEFRFTLPTGNLSKNIVAADLEHDGDLDIVCTNRGSGTVSILRNQGHGAFQSAENVSVSTMPHELTVADLNGDGRLDIIVCNYTAPGKVRVLTQQVNGQFVVSATYTVDNQPSGVAVGDMNGDGNPDVVLSEDHSGSAKSIAVLWNIGQGALQTPPIWLTQSDSGFLPPAVGDIDGDGDLDIVGMNFVPMIQYLINDGRGAFTVSITPWAGAGETAFQLRDFDGDQDLDLITCRTNNSNTICVLLNDGGGQFALVGVSKAGYPVTAFDMSDFDNDGHLDVAVLTGVNAGFVAMPGMGDGTFRTYTSLYEDETIEVRAIEIADIDGDNDPDIVAATASSGRLIVLRSLGISGFAAPEIYVLPVQVIALKLGDLDHDGDPDAIFSGPEENFYVMLNGAGVFAAPVIYTTLSGSMAGEPAVCDLNGDGRADVAMPVGSPQSTSSQLRVYLANPDGSLAAPTILAPGAFPSSATAADIDGDNDNDLVVANTNGNSVSIFRNQGAGTFGAATTLSTSVHPTSIAIDDLDHDGDRDLVICCGSNLLNVRRNNGNATFASQQTYDLEPLPHIVDLVDVDEDGWLDAVAACESGHDLAILQNNRAGGFLPRAIYATPRSPADVAHADFNGDGSPDLAIADVGRGGITLLSHLNETANVFASPNPRVAVVGQKVQFVAQANGNAALLFQWRKNGVALSDNRHISGARTGILEFASVVLGDAGVYDLEITNGACLNFDTAAQMVVLPFCRNDIANGDGLVAVGDLLQVITSWGVCPPAPTACVADIDESGRVDVSDLLAIITHWGPCP